MILAQTKIFSIFPESVQTSLILKTLSSFCSRTSIIIYHVEICGLNVYILTYQILAKNNI